MEEGGGDSDSGEAEEGRVAAEVVGTLASGRTELYFESPRSVMRLQSSICEEFLVGMESDILGLPQARTWTCPASEASESQELPSASSGSLGRDPDSQVRSFVNYPG